MLTIHSPFLSVQMSLADLTPPERNALAGLLGISSARKEAFQSLREMPLFKKIRPQDVFNTCPNRARDFDTEVEVILNPDTPEGRAAAEKFLKIMPTAIVSPAIHRVSGLCPRCHRSHSVERQSVLVKTVVAGVSFSNLYAA